MFGHYRTGLYKRSLQVLLYEQNFFQKNIKINLKKSCADNYEWSSMLNICEKKFVSQVRNEYGSYCLTNEGCRTPYFCNDGANCSNPLKFKTKICDCGCEYHLTEQKQCGNILLYSNSLYFKLI